MDGCSSMQDSVSAINKKMFASKEEEIAHAINKARFKNKEFIEEILSYIKENNNTATKTIEIKAINRTVHYYDGKILNSFLQYVHEANITSQILEDFTFLTKLNERFTSNFKNILKSEKNLGFSPTSQNTNIDLLRKTIPSESYYGYYIENISINNINLLLFLIILEEFVTLNRRNSNQTHDFSNVYIESDGSLKIDRLNTICFLGNHFSTLCLNLEEVEEGSNNKLYNIYLLLISKDYDETDLKSEDKKEQVTPQDEILEKKRPGHFPKKYDKIYIPNMQIPKSVIRKLVTAMDTDNDFKVTLQDIILFAKKHYIHFEKAV